MDPYSQLVILLLFLLVLFTAWWLFVWPRQRLRRLDRQPFPDAWRDIVHRTLPWYERFSREEQQHLQRLIKRFLADREFIPCAGQVVDDVVRVSVAAQACLLLLHRPGADYHGLRYILVYPAEFQVDRPVRDELGLVSRERNILAGESWEDGRLVLSWDNVREGIADLSDGHNVVLHEFAHQLDHQSGNTNGAPPLDSARDYDAWAAVMSGAFHSLQSAAEVGIPSVFDYYGATDPAEFFAVATEVFFEQPHALLSEHPDVFRQLQTFFRVDPRRWHEGSGIRTEPDPS